jgi:hypothetical protein
MLVLVLPPIELEQFNVEIDVEDENLPTPEHGLGEPKQQFRCI